MSEPTDFNFDLAARVFTNYRSSKDTEAEMAAQYKLHNSWEVKQTYTTHANKFREHNLKTLEKSLAVNYAKRIPDAYVSTCGAQHPCTVNKTDDTFALGVGRSQYSDKNNQ